MLALRARNPYALANLGAELFGEELSSENFFCAVKHQLVSRWSLPFLRRCALQTLDTLVDSWPSLVRVLPVLATFGVFA